MNPTSRRLPRALTTAALLVAALAPPASAQETTTTVTPTTPADEGATTAEDLDVLPVQRNPTFMEGGGVKLTEELMLHPMFELQTGYQTNVFSQDDSDDNFGGIVGAALMRLRVAGSVSTAQPNRGDAESASGSSAAPKLALKGDAELSWDQYLSTEQALLDQGGLGIGLLLDARFNPEGELTFQIKEGYVRDLQPVQSFSGQTVNRHKSDTTLGLIYKPGGGAIQGFLNWTLGLDIFERSIFTDSLDFANRMNNMFDLGVRWQWLPKTMFQFLTQFGFVTATEGVTKPGGAMPLRVWIGTSTLITPLFGVVIRAGYGNGFYDAGPSFNSYLAQLEGRYAIGPTVRTAFGYAHDFSDSLIGNYYVDHSLYGRVSMQFAGQWQARGKLDLRLRDYDGIIDPPGVDFCVNSPRGSCENDRFDIVARLDASLDYQYNQWLVLGASYTFNTVTTDFFMRDADGAVDSGGFVWNELLLKATAKF
jgi:hypothetical protein